MVANRVEIYIQLCFIDAGHYLGMDIHDCSMISFDCPLKPGVVSVFPD
jgi:Xaa-Pro aminopeptidase